MAKYKRQFVQLIKHAREIVPTEEDMCIHFEDGLKDEIKMLVGALEIREFMVLFDRAQKIEEICESKTRNEEKRHEFDKRGRSKAFSSSL